LSVGAHRAVAGAPWLSENGQNGMMSVLLFLSKVAPSGFFPQTSCTVRIFFTTVAPSGILLQKFAPSIYFFKKFAPSGFVFQNKLHCQVCFEKRCNGRIVFKKDAPSGFSSHKNKPA